MDSYDGFFARRQGFRTARQHVYQEGMRTVYSICASSTNRQHRRPLGNCWRIVRRGLIAIAKKAVASKQFVRNIPRWRPDSLDCSRSCGCVDSYGYRLRVSGSDRDRVGRPHNFLGPSDNPFQYYCGCTPLLGQDASIERCHFV